MTPIELISIILAALTLFWLLTYVGDVVAKTPKLFTYGKFRKFFN